MATLPTPQGLRISDVMSDGFRHVHDETCADLKKTQYQGHLHGGEDWDDYSSRGAVVQAHSESELKFFPCVRVV